jgi:hypothetical protein
VIKQVKCETVRTAMRTGEESGRCGGVGTTAKRTAVVKRAEPNMDVRYLIT